MSALFLSPPTFDGFDGGTGDSSQRDDLLAKIKANGSVAAKTE